MLQVTATFPPEAGGVETHVRELSSQLLRLGWGVEVMTSDRSGRLPRDENLDGVRVRRLPAWPKHKDWLIAPGMVSGILKTDADIVHVQGITDFTPPLAMGACRLRNIPYVVTFHTGGHPSRLRTQLRSVQWKVLSPLVRRASHRIAVGRYEASLFRRAMSGHDPEISVIRNGGHVLDPPPPQPTVAEQAGAVISEGAVRLLSVGRLERYKGHDRAIEAVAVLLGRGCDSYLTILGTGPDRDRLSRRSAALGVDSRVTIASLPAGDRSSMANEMARATVVLLLSRYEAHPLTVMEARSVGTPVLVLMGSGLTELVEEGYCTGVRREAGPEETATAIVKTIAGRIPAPNSPPVPTWEDCAVSVAAVYDRVLQRHR